MSRKQLSILMPSYNNTCVSLVKELAEQCSDIEGLRFEIIVADDGSTKYSAVSRNREINKIDGCRYIERKEISGRSAIRNFLAQSAKYENLMFLDSDVKIENDDFVLNYVDQNCKGVVYGGLHNDRDAYDALNLRCVYECEFEAKNPAAIRNTKEYQSFRTTNFMVPRDVMLKFPFDEGFKEYGYEDVLFGKTLKANGIPILHIDNPIVIDDYDTNAEFLDKTQQALRTLYKHRKELDGYSGVISTTRNLRRCCIAPILHMLYKMCGNRLYKHLCGKCSSVMLYNIYRVMYYISQPDLDKK